MCPRIKTLDASQSWTGQRGLLQDWPDGIMPTQVALATFCDRSPTISVVLVACPMSRIPILLPRQKTPLFGAGYSSGSHCPATATYWPVARSATRTLPEPSRIVSGLLPPALLDIGRPTGLTTGPSARPDRTLGSEIHGIVERALIQVAQDHRRQ